MNVYECNGKNIFMRRMMKSISSNENIFTIARMKTFIICFIRDKNTENRYILLTNFFSELKQNNIPCSKIIKI
jgi:hypothetical protein